MQKKSDTGKVSLVCSMYNDVLLLLVIIVFGYYCRNIVFSFRIQEKSLKRLQDK